MLAGLKQIFYDITVLHIDNLLGQLCCVYVWWFPNNFHIKQLDFELTFNPDSHNGEALIQLIQIKLAASSWAGEASWKCLYSSLHT